MIGAVVLLVFLLLAAIALFAVVVLITSGEGGEGDDALPPVFFNELNEIPVQLLPVYVEAVDRHCEGLSWTVLAGIGKVESDHGRYAGASIDPDGDVTPPIIGIPLDGTNSTRAIPDTDQGRLDGDLEWDRAVGPFQFIPESWERYGQDANGDGLEDPHNIHDAANAAALHLCPDGTVEDVDDAVLAYNRSRTYVNNVLDWSSQYGAALETTGPLVGAYSYPVPAQWMTEADATRPHHDFPALDLAVPAGTPVYAMVAGTITAVADNGGDCGMTVVLSGAEGASYTYCLFLDTSVTVGETVGVGQVLGLSGFAPPGSVRPTQLHLSITAAGQARCPQPLLLSLVEGTPIPPDQVPAEGCDDSAPVVDWVEWLDLRNQAETE